MALSDFPKVSDAYIKLVKFMTWPRFFKTLATIILIISMYTMFENRQMIYNGIISGSGVQTMIKAPISQTTKGHIQEVLDKSATITGIQVVSVDFKQNTRNTEYFRSNINGFQKVFDDYAHNKVAPTPFFNQDVINNERNTHLMNGEFVCYEIKKVDVFSKLGNIAPYADTVCSVSIPPYPGYFSGFITFYVKGNPGPIEQLEIKAIARKLSIGTYDADVSK